MTPSAATPAGAASPPLWRLFLAFLGPLVATNVLQALSGTLNNIYLGRMLGTDALAAAVAFFPLLMFLIALVIGLGTGSSILVGQAWGAKKLDVVQRVAGTSLAGAAVLGVVIAVAGWLGVDWMLAQLRTPPAVLAQATAYAHVLLLALPLLFVAIVASSLLRGVGDTVTPLRTLVVITASSMLLTPLFIRGIPGVLAPMDARAAAWAVLAGHLAALGWLAWHLTRKDHVFAWPRLAPHLRFDRELLPMVVRLGTPTGLFFVTGSLADIALLSLVNAHGVHATAAWGAVNQVMAYVQFPAVSISITTSVFAAQAIGGDRLPQVMQVTRIGLAMNLALTGGLALLAALLAPWVVGLFVTDRGVIDLASAVLHVTVVGSVFFGMGSVFSGVMRAAGTVRVPTLISLSCLALLVFPLGWLFDRTLGLRWIWLAYPATYGTGLLLQALYFQFAWRRRPIRKLV